MAHTSSSSDNNLLFTNTLRYFQKLQELQLVLMDRYKNASPMQPPQHDPFGIGNIITRMMTDAVQNPERFWESQTRLYQQAMDYWQSQFNSEVKQETIAEKTESYQKYFKNAFWDNSFVFKSIKETYLMTSMWLIDMIEDENLGIEGKDKEKLRFVMRQYVEAMNPRNFPLTNPEVIEETLNTHGENLIKGLDNFIHDIQKNDKFISISMTDDTAFKLGENIATTAGDVVFENEYIELIQYKPTTKDVFKTPLVITPPWINKYYILDLKPENSLIQWLVDQGHTVFVMSWTNPDKSFADKGFIDYVNNALLKSVEVANTICGTKQANVIGYCIGGTLLSLTLAYLQAKNISSPIKTATLLTTLLDFEQAGDIKVFIDEDQLSLIDQMMEDQGVLDGEVMKMTFSMLRAGDLIWSFAVNNYLLGRDPVPFDLLYWNNDATNLPARLHHDYLSSMYLQNQLAKGEYELDEVKLDLGAINTPAYFLSAQDDHIAPWRATYKGAQLFSGDTTFTLTGSGHVAGVINPPVKNKYFYKVGQDIKGDADEWEGTSTRHNGSWWPHWQEWVSHYNTDKCAARAPVKSIRPAPGRNVLKKI